MKKCSYCGRENDDTAVTCRECGSPMPEDAALSGEPIKVSWRKCGTETRYTKEEMARLQQIFAPVASRYRQHIRTAIVAAIASMCWFLLLALVFKPSDLAWGYLIPLPICWIIGVGATVFAPKLVCPGCKERMDDGLEQYCPECGSNQLQARDWISPPQCRSCGKYLGSRKGRQYKIRTCTHCGLLLDEKGF